MQQSLDMRLPRSHRDDHGLRLVVGDAAHPIGSAETVVAATARGRSCVMDGPDHDESNVVPLFGPGASDTGSAATPIRVLLADGEGLARAGYRVLLERDELIEVVAEAATEEEAVTLAGETSPDVALLDVDLLGADDLEAVARLVSHPAFANVALMLVVPRRTAEDVLDAVLAGAVGVLAKDAEPAELICAVQVLARGQALLPVDAVHRLLGELPTVDGLSPVPPGRLEELTGRERELMVLVARGLSNDEIAARLAISSATVKTHVSHAMLKLHATHRAQLVALAYETGLVHPRAVSGERLASPRGVAPDRDDEPIRVETAR